MGVAPRGWAALGLGAFIVVSTIASVIVGFSPLPFYDQWDNLVAGRTIEWSWLVSQHNEHRLLLPRLVFILDHALSHETNRVDLTMSLLVVGATCALLLRLARRGGLMADRTQAFWTTGLVTGLLFSSVQIDNFTSGFQVQFFGVSLLTVASLAVLILARPSLLAVTAVVLLEAAALYTLSSGIVTLILTVVASLWLGRPRLHSAILVGAGVLLAASYLHGYVSPDHHTDPLAAVSHLDRILGYGLAEIGMPVSSLIFAPRAMVAVMAGGLGLAALVALGLKLRAAATEDRPIHIAWIVVAAFAIGVAGLTALGRSDFGLVQAMSGRYTTPMLLFWLALIMLVAMEAARQGPARRRVLERIGVALLVVIAIHQPLDIVRAKKNEVVRRMAVPAILAGVDDTAMLEKVHPSAEAILARIPTLKQDRASIFAEPWALWLGGPVPGAEASTPLSACAGASDPAIRLDDASQPSWRVTGRLTPGAMPGLSDRLVFLDPDHNVVGYGLDGFRAKALGRSAEPGSPADRWLGAIAYPDPASVTAVALGIDDRPVCSLGTLTPAR